ncbi:TonB-dependent siderophore receptor [bacterium]|nr:TonB-dependent siderophore receptor [bacterium]
MIVFRPGFLLALGFFPMGQAFAQDIPAEPDGAEEPPLVIDEIVVTGFGGSYPNGLDKEATIGVLGDRALLDTPISAKSFTETFIADQIAFTSAELSVRDASFVSGQSTNLTGEVQGFLRGFPTSGADASFDGSAQILRRRFPLELIERVDILKGPNTFYSGTRFNGGVGGSINYASKKPTGDFQRFTSLYGGGSQFGGQADISTRFGENDAFGVRANFAYRDGETSVDGVSEENRVAHIALNWHTDVFDLDLQYGQAFARIDGTDFGFSLGAGLPVPPVPDPETYRGPDWANTVFDFQFARAALTVALTENWSAFASYGASAQDEDFVYNFVRVINENGDAAGFPLREFSRGGWGDLWSGDVGIRGEFTTGPVTHRVLASYGENQNVTRFGQGIADTDGNTLNIFDPSSFDVARPDFVDSEVFVLRRDRGRGGLITDEIGLLDDRLLVTVGLRWANLRQERFNFAAPSPDGPNLVYDESDVSPHFGILYKATERISVYANALRSLEFGAVAPAIAVNANEATPPGVAQQHEVGAKADFGRYGATVSAFEITRPSAFLDPDTLVFGLFGRQRHRGLEIDLFGEIREGLRVHASYAYLDAALKRSAGGTLDGRRPIGVPEHVLTLGLDASIPQVEGLGVLFNYRHVGAQFIDLANARSIDATDLVDFGVRYGWQIGETTFVARVNASNVFNELYFPSARGNFAPGAPRTFRATITASF